MAKKKAAKKAQVKKAVKQGPAKRKTPVPKAPRTAIQELKRQVKEKWPQAKNLADARREELTALIEGGDAELLREHQERWAQRSKERHEAWIRGESKSAQAAREKRKA